MMNKKILIADIFTILLLLTIPNITAKNQNKHTCSEIIENPKVKPLDNYEEIITLIKGVVNGVQINGWFAH